jgi:hypothetical protein
MPVVKNSMPSKLGAEGAQILAVDHRLLPIIGLASRPVFRAASCFEYWNLAVPIIGLLWSLKFGAWSLLSSPHAALSMHHDTHRLTSANFG